MTDPSPGPSQHENRRPSFDPRMSASDLSLRTLPAYTTLPKDDERHLTHTSIMADKLARQVCGAAGARAQTRASRMDSTDGGASFVTARGTMRGTLRSVGPDGTVREEEVMVWVGPEPGGDSSATPSALSIAYPDDDETPFPSRVLRLHHPGKVAPQGLQGRIDQFFEVDSWTLLGSAKDGVEKAFWGLVMPSIAGMKGLSDVVGDMIGSLTLPVVLQLGSDPFALTSETDLGSASSSPTDPEPHHQPRLYADETIYTLRLPAKSAKTLDLGNTARPILVRKRGSLPAWDGQAETGMGWGKEFGPGWR